MKIILKIGGNIFFSFCILFSFAFGDPKIKKIETGRCTGSRYCSACTNCSRCNYCGAGGVCGVCSPESFRVKPKPAAKKKAVSKNKRNVVQIKKK